MKNNKSLSGKFILLLTAAIWGSGFTFTDIALDYFTTFQVIALRFSIAFVVLLIVFFNKLGKITKDNFIKGGIIGTILFGAYLFQTLGLEFTTTSKNSFLTAVNVVLVPFIAWLVVKNKLSKNALLGAFVTLVGIGFTSFTSGKAGGFNIGDVISLVGAVFFAGHLFYADHYGDHIESWKVMILQMGTAAFWSWVAVLVSGESNFVFTTQSMMPILYIGFITTLLAYALMTIAQKMTTSAEAAIILSTEAFFGMLTAIWLLNDPISLPMIIGGILIFCGILVVELKPFKETA